MRRAPAAHHVDEVVDDLLSAEKRAVHPTTPLLHEGHQVGWSIGEGLGIGDVGKLELAAHLDVDLKAHDSILGQILIRFGASGRHRTCDILEESVEGSSLDRLPAEHRVSSGQHLCEAEERLAGLVGSVTHLVFVELCSLDHIGAKARVRAALAWALTGKLVGV